MFVYESGFFLVFWWSLGWFLGEFVYGKWLQDPSSQHQVAQCQKDHQQVAASAVFPEWEADTLPHCNVLDPGWSSTQKVHGCFLPISRGSNSGINIAKPWKTMVSEAFFLIQKLIVETSFCALLVPNLDQGISEPLQPTKKKLFGVTGTFIPK